MLFKLQNVTASKRTYELCCPLAGMREETMKLQKEREEIEKEKAKLIALKSGKGIIYKDAFSFSQ